MKLFRTLWQGSKKSLICKLALVLSVMLFSIPAFAQWPMAGANPARTSWVPEEVNGPYNALWALPIEPYISQNVQIIAADGKLFISTSKGLYAINAETAAHVWTYATDSPLGHSPTYDNGVLYVGGFDRKLHAINATTGAKLWSFDEAKAGYRTNPLVVDNLVLLGNRDGYFYAIHKEGTPNAGQLAWKFKTDGPILYSAAYKDGKIYFGSQDMHCYALNASDGSLVWKSARIPGDGMHSWWPVIYRDWVVISTRANYRMSQMPGCGSAGLIHQTSGYNEVDTELINGIERDEIFPTGGTTIGAEGTEAGDWADGTQTYDATKATQYFEGKPWRRNRYFLNISDGSDYGFDYDNDGKKEYPPFLTTGTKNGTPSPPMVSGYDDVIYASTMYKFGTWICRGGIVGWKVNTPFISKAGNEDAVDEPVIASGGGRLVYSNLCCDREAHAWDVSRNGLGGTIFNYDLHNKIPGYNSDMWVGADPNNLSGLVGAYGTANGVYHNHTNDQNPVIPYNGKVYMHRGNSILCFGSGTQRGVLPKLDAPTNPTEQATTLTETELKQTLETEIQKWLDAGHLHGGYFNGGQSAGKVNNYLNIDDYFQSPSENLYVLLRALPHVPASMQTQLRAFIQSEMQNYNPLQIKSIGWKDGASRTWSEYPPEVLADMPNYGPSSISFNHSYQRYDMQPFTFYVMWKYAQVFGNAEELYNQCKPLIVNFLDYDDETRNKFPQFLNERIAGFWGYLELEKLAGQPEDAWVRSELDEMLAYRKNNFSKDSAFPFSPSHPNKVNISRNFIYMTPELAGYLRDNILSKVQEAVNEYEFVAPYWFVSCYEGTLQESTIQNLFDNFGLFHAKAWILGASQEELQKYLDVPGFERGDLIYLNNLITLIEKGSENVSGTTYYVSTAGNDSNNGTSENQSWKTIAKINASSFQAGDKILLKGGDTFTDSTLKLGNDDQGTPQNPITVSSFGTGKATLAPGGKQAVYVLNTGGIELRDLIIQGDGKDNNSNTGVFFYNNLANNVKLEHIVVDNLDISGYGYVGMEVGGWNNQSGYKDVQITNCDFHDNGQSGLETWGDNRVADLAHENIYVANCRSYNNSGVPDVGHHSGNGIIISGVDGAVVEYCEAWNNGALNNYSGGGPVGIWCWDANNVIIQYCESYNNKTNSGKDGGGFDIDGGASNCILQYNYSHDNDGAGYLICQYNGAQAFENNIVRYNISENDGRKNSYGAIHFWSSNSNGGIKDTLVYGNTIYLTKPASGSPSAIKIDSGGIYGTKVFNNIFQTKDGLNPVRSSNSSAAEFYGNCYWSSGDSFNIYWAGTTYNSLSEWRDNTGMERLNDIDQGFQADPKLTAPGTGGTIGDVTKLDTLNAYKLQSNSPCSGAGLNPSNDLGIDPGTQDFYGTSIPLGTAFEIGANELNDTATNQAPVVDAGVDQVITLPASANLDGTVNDDGLPAAYTVQWTIVSGPGGVTFGNANAEDTSASFVTDGTYVLRLTADDTALQTSSDVTITVNPEPLDPPTGDAFVEANGAVCIEAENYDAADQRSDPNNVSWTVSSATSGSVGSYVTTPGPQGSNGSWSNACELSYQVNFSTAGTYKIWVRRNTTGGASNSGFVGINDSQAGYDNAGDYNQWIWKGGYSISVSAGTQTIRLRRREAGYMVDRIYITMNGDIPSGNGPSESSRDDAPPPPATYTLTVNAGTGDGDYAEGEAVNITADTPPTGQEFDVWTGDVANLADINSASTTLTMPAGDINITATYRDIVPGQTIDITVLNHSFEQDGAGNPSTVKTTDFTNVLGWTGDVDNYDAGVEQSSNWSGTGGDAVMHAYGYTGDNIYQVLDHTINEGEEYTLTFAAAPVSSQIPVIASILYDDNGTLTELASYETPQLTSSRVWAEYNVNVTIPAGSPAIGKKLAIQFLFADRTESNPYYPLGWGSLDNIRVKAKVADAPTDNNLLENPGFETGDTSSWFASGNIVADPVHGGTSALEIAGGGRVAQDIKHLIEAGKTYRFRSYVKITTEGSSWGSPRLRVSKWSDLGAATFGEDIAVNQVGDWVMLELTHTFTQEELDDATWGIFVGVNNFGFDNGVSVMDDFEVIEE